MAPSDPATPFGLKHAAPAISPSPFNSHLALCFFMILQTPRLNWCSCCVNMIVLGCVCHSWRVGEAAAARTCAFLPLLFLSLYPFLRFFLRKDSVGGCHA